MSAFERVLDAARLKGCAVQRRGTIRGSQEASVICPAHEDVNPSLSVSFKDSKVLLHCHAGCSQAAVIKALGLKPADLTDEPEVVATYDYVDESGELVYQVLRYEPKNFRNRAPDGAGGWTWSLRGVRQVPYRLPELLRAVQLGSPVYLAEGEKDANAIAELGYAATNSKRWRDEYGEYLRGADVIVVADNDVPGDREARAVVAKLEAYAKSVRLVKPAQGKDAYDHIAAGLSVRDFVPVKTGRLTRLTDIRQRDVAWLWEGMVPLGEISIVAGMEGAGKSTVAAKLAADVSRGDLKGELAAIPRTVILCCTEDRYETTIKPRILAAGGDPEMVYRFDDASHFSLPDDIAELESAVKQVDAALVVLDPLTSRIGNGLDTYRDADVRKALEPLAAMAHELDCAVIGLMHQNKSKQSDLRNALIAGRAFSAVARSVLWCVEYGDEWLFGPDKANLAEKQPAKRYAIETATVSGGVTTSRAVWLGNAGIRIRDAFGG